MFLKKTIVKIILLLSIILGSSFLYNPGSAHSTTTSQKLPQLQSCLIFDLGGVLIETDIFKTFWHMGPRDLFRFWKNSKFGLYELQGRFYQILNKITKTRGNPYKACDEHGNELPILFCDWLLGARSSNELYCLFITTITENPHWCKSNTEQKLLLKMAHLIFNPIIFAQTRKLIPEGVNFVKECKDRGYKIYVLSNWDSDSFSHVAARFPDFFSLFDGLIISGHIKKIKPMRTIYHHFLDNNNLNWILIDDQKDNIIAAKNASHRIKGIHCGKKQTFFTTKKDFDAVRKKLHSLEKKLKNKNLAINKLH